MKRTTAALLLVLALSARASADPVMAPNDPFASPVSVNACNLEYADENRPTSRISAVAIQFTNESARVADLINFRVAINGQTSLIRDVGTFTPGIEITHKFKAGTDQFTLPVLLQQFGGRPPVTCRVESIHFADGTAWQPGSAGGSPAASGGALSVLPLRLAFDGPAAGARLVYVTSATPASYSIRTNCDRIARLVAVASSARDAVYRVTPLGSGFCAATIVDAGGNAAMIPIVVK
ncbi:MAG TPA: hypothetical protein VIG46_08040 [Candidatus Baltobacteraceae bacterium]|jgi:hypothetical protein